jgi:putative toxin-antitoxin system antitoxin component (TIGR02293 family)
MTAQIEPIQVAQALGLERHGSFSWLDFNATIQQGFPVATINTLREAMAPRMHDFEALVASPSTIKRHRRNRRPLSPQQSERLAQLAEVWAMARAIYQDDETARTFLQRPHPLLHGRTPLAVAAESWAGARTVEQILGRLKFGSAA